MNKAQLINEWVSNVFPDEEFLLANGFEEAFLGVAIQFNKHIAIFDYDKCLKILQKDGMTSSEAEEFMSFNVTGSWVGEGTPAFLFRYKD